MSIFTDRRTLKQIGGLRAYLRQVSWSLHWQIAWRRRVRRTIAVPDGASGGPAALPDLPRASRGASVGSSPTGARPSRPGLAALQRPPQQLLELAEDQAPAEAGDQKRRARREGTTSSRRPTR